MIQTRLHPLKNFSLGESILEKVVIVILSLEKIEKKKGEEEKQQIILYYEIQSIKEVHVLVHRMSKM